MRSYRHADGIEIDRLPNETAITASSGDIIVLNHTATIVFDSLKDGGNELKAARALAAQYGIPESKVERDTRRCMAKLRGEGVIQLAHSNHTGKNSHGPLFTRRSFTTGALVTALTTLWPTSKAHAKQQKEDSLGYWDGKAVNGWRLWEDPRGFKIKLPEKIEKVAPVGSFAHSMMETIDPSMIVRASSWGIGASTDSSRKDIASELEDASGACVCEYVIENEQPDIILSIVPKDIHISTNERLSSNEAGVPIVHMVVGPDDIPKAYETLGELFAMQRPKDIAEYLKGLRAVLVHDKDSIPEDEKIRLYIGKGKLGLNTDGISTLLDKTIQIAGAFNAAADYKGRNASLTEDDISDLQPDFVVLCPDGELFERKYSNECLGLWTTGALSGVCPVFGEPEIPYGWMDRSPLIASTIGAAWLGAMIHPDNCSYDISELSTEFWDYMFGIELSAEEMGVTPESAILSHKVSNTSDNGSSAKNNNESNNGISAAGASRQATDPSYESPDVNTIPSQAIAATASRMSSFGGGGGGTIGGGGGTIGGGGGTGGGSGSGTGSGTGNKEPVTPTPTAEEVFITELQNHFGFDSEVASLISMTLSACHTFCKSLTTNRELTVAYVFFRSIGGFFYGDEDVFDQFRWDQTAGSAAGIYDRSIINNRNSIMASEQQFFVQSLGLSDAQYKKLRYYVRLQHEFSGQTTLETKKNYPMGEASFNNAKTNYINGNDLSSITDSSFNNILDGLMNNMCVMPDFCHFCITTATHLATDLGLTVSGDAAFYAMQPNLCAFFGTASTTRESFAGWLGDAILSQNASGPTFGWDDYWSDIDALKIAKLLVINTYDVRKAFSSYYSSKISTFKRNVYFTPYFSADKAAQAIDIYINKKLDFKTVNEVINALNSNAQYKNTTRFLQTLTGALSEGTYRGTSI